MAEQTAQTVNTQGGKKALLIGGGAPNSTLIAGALAAFLDAGIHFDVISTSGAGALMGLLYTAPLNDTPREALARWAQIGVADSIYEFFPVNYKVFMKPGMAAGAYRNTLSSMPWANTFFDSFGGNPAANLWSDWTQLFLATMSPTDLTPQSLGLCAHLPFVEQVVDFDAVAAMQPEFYINAYNLTKEHMTTWGKRDITPAHVRAALSFPFIYPPTEIDGNDYIEGAALDSINFKPLVSDDDGAPGLHRDVDTLVVFDILGDDQLIRKPRNLYDAWVRSIITPLVKIAKSDMRLFELQHNIDPLTGRFKRRLLKVDLTGGIPPDHWPEVLDWSESNLKLLFDIGYQAGRAFCEAHPELMSRESGKVERSPLAPERTIPARSRESMLTTEPERDDSEVFSE
ncbi:patatin-like phospholipase family protein [Paraburkholderia sp. GAS42]|uniref:patatin-like phospholipase family protein n=1 Tax=Paraburkholderia sp. GAS42 TaxID=3035135 RepID=UPI003D255DA4